MARPTVSAAKPMTAVLRSQSASEDSHTQIAIIHGSSNSHIATRNTTD